MPLATAQRPLALARWAVARAAQGEPVAVELEAPARPLLHKLIDEGAMRRALLLLERDGNHSRIAARPRHGGGATTITELFEEDHKRIDEIAAGARRAAPEDAMQAIKLTQLLCFGLRRHIRIEESIVLPLHEARTRYAATSEFMKAEHKAILAYVERLEREADAVRVSSQRDKAVARLLDAEAGLAAILADHNAKEEGRLFPLLDHTTPASARDPLLRQIVTF